MCMSTGMYLAIFDSDLKAASTVYILGAKEGWSNKFYQNISAQGIKRKNENWFEKIEIFIQPDPTYFSCNLSFIFFQVEMGFLE